MRRLEVPVLQILKIPNAESLLPGECFASTCLLLSPVSTSIELCVQRIQRAALRTFLCKMAAMPAGVVRQAAGPSHDRYFAATAHNTLRQVLGVEYTYVTALTSSLQRRTCRRVSMLLQHLKSQWRLPTSQTHPSRKHPKRRFLTPPRSHPPLQHMLYRLRSSKRACRRTSPVRHGVTSS